MGQGLFDDPFTTKPSKKTVQDERDDRERFRHNDRIRRIVDREENGTEFCNHENHSCELSPMHIAIFTCRDCGARKFEDDPWSTVRKSGGQGSSGPSGLTYILISFLFLFLWVAIMGAVDYLKCHKYSFGDYTRCVEGKHIKTDNSYPNKGENRSPSIVEHKTTPVQYSRVYIHSKSGVNIRSGPDMFYNTMGTINRGDEVYIVRNSDEKWVRVFRKKWRKLIYQGYVFRPLLHLTK